MSKMTDELSLFLDSEPYDIIRISVCNKSGGIETLERQELAFCQNTYSVAKFYTMVAIGILYDKGLLTPDEKICDILKAYLPAEIPDKRWLDITIHHALTHTAGLPGGFLDIDVHKSTEFTDDFLSYSFNTPLDYTPGTERQYSDGAYYLLSRVVSEKAGVPLDDFLWKELFLKLDFQEVAWSRCPKGYPMGATGLYINSADMVKMGAVYLNGGMYGDKRILSEEWVNLSVEKEYGLRWSEDKICYSKGGMNGQTLTVVPSKNIAIAIQSYGGDCGRVTEWMLNYYS